MAQQPCRVPKCYQTINTRRCMAPNPWILFLRLVKGQHLTKQQKKNAYDQYKAIYDNVKTKHDEDTYRGALCLQKLHLGRPPREPQNISIVNLRQRLTHLLAQNTIHYRKECDIPDEVLHFFKQITQTKIQGTTLNVCEVVPLLILKGCVPNQERRFYTFESYLGRGLHGFVFNCRYKNQEDRVVKIVVLRRPGQQVRPIHFSGESLEPLNTDLFQREANVYQMLVRKTAEHSHSLYRIPQLYGTSCITEHTVTDPRTRRKRTIALGSYVMERIPESFNESELFRYRQFKNDHKRKLHTIVKVLHQLMCFNEHIAIRQSPHIISCACFLTNKQDAVIIKGFHEKDRALDLDIPIWNPQI